MFKALLTYIPVFIIMIVGGGKLSDYLISNGTLDSESYWWVLFGLIWLVLTFLIAQGLLVVFKKYLNK